MARNDQFIYLVPGNWFEIKNINKDKTVPYDLENFTAEIMNQVSNRSEKLNFIQIAFGTKYRNNSVEDIVFCLDKKKFGKIIKMLASERRHPIITFHGTSNLAVVESIFQNGYVVPGSKNKTGLAIAKKHGSAYGPGIYTSPHLEKALQYTNPDKINCVYIIINLLMPGVMKLIPPGQQYTNFGDPANGTYADGANTRAVYGLEQVISADSDRVVPIAHMKINIG